MTSTIWNKFIETYLKKTCLPRVLLTEEYLGNIQYEELSQFLFQVKYIFEKMLNGKLIYNSLYKPELYNDFAVCSSTQFDFNINYKVSSWIFINNTYQDINQLPKELSKQLIYFNSLYQYFSSFTDIFDFDMKYLYFAHILSGLFFVYPTNKNSSCSDSTYKRKIK